MEGGVWKFADVGFQGSHFVYGTDAKGLCSHRHLVGSSLLTIVLQFCFSKGAFHCLFPTRFCHLCCQHYYECLSDSYFEI